MNSTGTAPASPNGASTPQELFVLTDEQILEMEDHAAVGGARGVILSGPATAGGAKTASSPRAFGAENLSSGATSDEEHSQRDSSFAALSQNDSGGTPSATSLAMDGQRRPDGGAATSQNFAQPPKWLTDMMVDPQAGAEARDLWSGVQQARQEAAAFREVFAKPEEARAAAERARALGEIDAAFYGGAGKPPEEASAARAALAQRLLREDPAAFREMVFAGLRALEEAGTNAAAQSPQAPNSGHPSAIEPAGQASRDSSLRLPAAGRLGMTQETEAASQTAAHDAQVAAYRAFENAANQELERSVGSAIDRAVSQALPNADRSGRGASAGARPATASTHAVPVQERLSAAIREDIEAALKADRQLGEQVAQVLTSRRFDDSARAQVVRLINDRAQQLVPTAAKRVINDWTQATLAAHRTKHGTENSTGRAGLAPAGVSSAVPRGAPAQARHEGSTDTRAVILSEAKNLSSMPRRVDYRKLSDEQILEL